MSLLPESHDWLDLFDLAGPPATALGFSPEGLSPGARALIAAFGGAALAFWGLFRKRINREKNMDPTKRHMVMASAVTLIQNELKKGDTVQLNPAMVDRSVTAALRLIEAADKACAERVQEEVTEGKGRARKALGKALQEIMKTAQLPADQRRHFFLKLAHDETGEVLPELILADSQEQVQIAVEKHGCRVRLAEEVVRPSLVSKQEAEGLRTLVQHAETQTGLADDDPYVSAACVLLRRLNNMEPRLPPEKGGKA